MLMSILKPWSCIVTSWIWRHCLTSDVKSTRLSVCQSTQNWLNKLLVKYQVGRCYIAIVKDVVHEYIDTPHISECITPVTLKNIVIRNNNSIQNVNEQFHYSRTYPLRQKQIKRCLLTLCLLKTDFSGTIVSICRFQELSFNLWC